MIKNYQKIKKKYEQMDYERLISFLKSYSSRLSKKEGHCRDLIDNVSEVPYITSILGSGLNVINNKNKLPKMSEEVYQKGLSILGYAQKVFGNNYTEEEIIFTMGYTILYHKRNEIELKVS